MQQPLISVLMPAYNAEKFISEAIESILNQTYKNFEFIIIDDASTDRTWGIMRQYAEVDKRIHIYQNKKQLGIAHTRNRLIKRSKGPYIVWQDADDISLPYRLQEQYSFMEKHSKVGMVGGYLHFFDDKGNQSIRKYEHDDKAIRSHIFKYSPVAQPAAMIRRECFETCGYLNPKYIVASDLDMSFRIGIKYRFANIQKTLIYYRIHPLSITSRMTFDNELTTLHIRNLYKETSHYKMKAIDKIYNLFQYFFVYIIPPRIKRNLFVLFRNNTVKKVYIPKNTFPYMGDPLVSICIPTHNRLSFFKQALKSAQKQTYDTIEIVISDNSDDDTTQKYVATLKDERIKYYRNALRHDFLFNFDKVEQLANGKYIKYLLDDDLLKPDCVSKMVQVLEQYPKVGVVMAPLNIIDENGDRIKPKFYFFRKMKYLYKYLNHDSYVRKEKIMNDFLTTIYPCCVPTGIMFRRSLFHSVKGFDKTFKEISDLELCMNFATKMDFFYINEFLSSWRYSHFSATISVIHKIGIELDIYYKLVHKYFLYTTSHQKAYFFASKRTALNVLAGARSKNPTLIFETLRVILYNDPYILNKIYLPFDLLFEVVKSLFHI